MLFVCICLPATAQRKMTEAQRKTQQDFIRKDTLPVKIEALPDEINTRFSEYAGQLFSDSTFMFSSMRADVAEDNDNLFETSWYCNLYQSKLLQNGDYEPAEALPLAINTIKAFNSNYCFNEKRDIIIYSRCVKNGDGALQCSLWQSQKKGDSWGKAQKLPAVINAVGTSNMQPCLVETEDRQVLYFVSDRVQGVGGLDIWFSILKDGKYNPPINAGTVINTEGNEVTPFYDKEGGILYFSSDEHIGIGDYDIFYSMGALSQWGEVSNMGVPFNSEYNDYYYNAYDHKSGFFSSNRPHDGMEPGDTCCNDLFRFEWVLPEKEEPTIDTPTIAEKISSVLPISLYFQNDQPDPKTVSDTTETDYPSLYRQYLKDHELYVSESGRGLSGDRQQVIREEMSAFMRDSVATGYERLMQLERYLKEALLAGDSVSLTISGFASPLHNSDYNKHLSMRRITSLLNHLYQADNGFFKPYMTGEVSGLIINVEPQGAVNHTFNTEETRETVYGVQAAKDRKIVITQ